MFDINKNLSYRKDNSPEYPSEQNSICKPKLFDHISTNLRVNHHSKKTEEAYIGWIRRFILFHNKRHLLGHSTVHPVRYFV